MKKLIKTVVILIGLCATLLTGCINWGKVFSVVAGSHRMETRPGRPTPPPEHDDYNDHSNDPVCYYGCPNSKKVKKLNLSKRKCVS